MSRAGMLSSGSVTLSVFRTVRQGRSGRIMDALGKSLLRSLSNVRQVLRVIPHNQTENFDSPRKVPIFRKSLRNTSWLASSAASRFLRMAKQCFNTVALWLSYSSAKALSSPAWARRMASASEETALESFIGENLRVSTDLGSSAFGRKKVQSPRERCYAGPNFWD